MNIIDVSKTADKKHLSNIRELILSVGENPERQGLEKTPGRYIRAFRSLTEGYSRSLEEVINGALFDAPSQEMVIVKNIEFYSLCEHHLVPFFGRCHVGYIPDKKIIGLSKIPRIVDVFARRLQVQERLTAEISKTMMDVLNAQGVGVVTDAQHLCMMMRGVEKQGASAIASSLLGEFRESPTRAEFFNLIK